MQFLNYKRGKEKKQMNKEISAIMMYWYQCIGAPQPIYEEVFRNLSIEYKITVIAGIPHYRKGRKELWREYRGVFYKESIEAGLCIKSVFVFSPKINIGFDKNGILRRFINYLSFFISAFFAIWFDRKSEPTFFFVPTFPPFFGGLLACLISKIKKTSFVYKVHDVYPDILFSVKMFRIRFISHFLGKIEKRTYSRAKHIIVVSNRVKETLYEKGVPLEKITVIPEPCNTDFIRPLPKNNDFSKEYNLQDKFVVLYAGNISKPQGIEFIIEAANIIKNQSDILLVLVGRGEKKMEIEKLIEDYKLRNVISIPLQPVERMPRIWASADISIASLRKNISHLAFPSKIYSILSSGRPIIAMVDKGSEIWEFIEESKGGICVEAEDSKNLAKKIMFLYDNSLLRKRMGENGRKFMKEKFSKEVFINQYKNLFDKIYP